MIIIGRQSLPMITMITRDDSKHGMNNGITTNSF